MAVQTAEKKVVIKAIDELGRQVTAADVATKTGLPILTATSELNTVATETGGHLVVSESGDIAYKFGLGFQNAYLAKGIKRFFEIVGSKTFELAFFLLRISFGIMLILSFLIVIGLILVIMMRGGSDRDRDRGGGFDFSFFDYLILRDLFYWGTNTAYRTHGYGSRYDKRRLREHPNFLLNCFSFLFGDGNPNEDLEERRFMEIAELIRANSGVVTSEQLAPYTGANPQNEDGVLPVLVRFNGRPEVTDSGNIVYVFPELQVSATTAINIKPESHLKEYRWKFTEAAGDELIPVYFLAGVNFLGSAWLWTNAYRFVEIYSFMPLINLIFVYGLMFVLIPLIRFGVISIFNSRIEKRNKQREQYANLVANADEHLQNKLKEAEKFKLARQRVSGEGVYSTEKDLLDQEFE